MYDVICTKCKTKIRPAFSCDCEEVEMLKTEKWFCAKCGIDSETNISLMTGLQKKLDKAMKALKFYDEGKQYNKYTNEDLDNGKKARETIKQIERDKCM